MKSIWSNVLRGCAYGDACGHTNEFKSYGALTANSKACPRSALDRSDHPGFRRLWHRHHPLAASAEDVESFLTKGFDTVRACLAEAQAAVSRSQAHPWPMDTCAFAGEGWRAGDARLEPRCRNWIAEAERFDFGRSSCVS
jgi:hypothetical protein